MKTADTQKATKKIVIFILGVGFFVGGCIIAYKYFRANSWIAVIEEPNRGISVEESLLNKAPDLKIILTNGKAKFLENQNDKEQVLLGYKLSFKSRISDKDIDITTPAQANYRIGFIFTLIDKDGFPIHIVESPEDSDLFVLESKLYTAFGLQRICSTSIAAKIARKVKKVYLGYILRETHTVPLEVIDKRIS